MFRMFTRMLAIISVLGSLLVLAPPRPAYAAGILVNTGADSNVNDGFCSLREAITAANMDSAFRGCTAGSGADVISFAADYTITLGSQLPVVNTVITLNGRGMAKTIIQANAAPDTATYRLFRVMAPGSLTLRSLTARNGRCAGGCQGAAQEGGGIYNTGTVKIINSRLSGNRASDKGGGIMNFNGGVLVITNSTITGNNAPYGAGIFNTSTLTMGRSTISSNSGDYGGGIMNNGGTAQIANSTFGWNGAANYGGGLYIDVGTVTINNSTFSTNSGALGANLYNGGTLNLQNTILANSVLSPDCYNAGVMSQNIHNLIEINSLAPNNCDTPYISGDPDLGPLANNGGPTQTFALLPGSQAIDAGDAATCKAIDQRGAARPEGPQCDIGSFELKQQKMDFRSAAAQDGWVLESTENSDAGGTLNSTATVFRLGDSAADQQYRSILSFNTSALPDNAVVTGAVLKVKRQGLTGSNPFLTHGTILIDIRRGPFSGSAALQLTDFQALNSNTAVGWIGNFPSSAWYSSTLQDVAFPYVNRLGLTQFRLRHETDDNDDLSADYLSFFSGNYGTVADRPLLTIHYYTP